MSKYDAANSMMRSLIVGSNTNAQNENGALEGMWSSSSHDTEAQDLQQSMSSVSSATSNSMSFNKIIKDFKKSLTERKTPRNIMYLNRIMVMIFLATIVLSCTEFGTLN